MARPYVFLVHGVGLHSAGSWADTWRAGLVAGLKRYRRYRDLDDAEIEQDHVRFIAVSYDAIFEGFRNRWGALAAAFQDQQIAGPAKQALDWVADQDADDPARRFFWENVLDVFLWHLVPQARMAVIARVARQLTEGLAAMYAENEGANLSHIVAHSLGTSVIHDSLVSLYASPEFREHGFDPQKHQFKSLFMVANTSRLLQPFFRVSNDVDLEAYKAYTSAVRPGSRKSITSSYYNIHHRADPITWPRHFAPANWPDNFYNDVETTRYDELKRVHDFEHYVANPRFHFKLFRRVLGNNRLATPDEFGDMMREFEADFPKQAAEEFSRLKDFFNGDRERELSPVELVRFLVEAVKELE